MISEEYLGRKGNCFQLKASFRILPIFAGDIRGCRRKKIATADYCARSAAITVHSFIKQAGSFISLHL
jgi:hypothetical protein